MSFPSVILYFVSMALLAVQISAAAAPVLPVDYDPPYAEIDPRPRRHGVAAKRTDDGVLHRRAMLLSEGSATDEARELFLTSWKQEADPWNLLSLRELLWIYLDREQWDEVLHLLRRGDPEYLDFFYARAEALYRSQRYTELIDLLERKSQLSLRSLPWNRVDEGFFRREAALWRVVATLRLGVVGWEDELETFVRHGESTPQHTRLHLYFQHRNEALDPALRRLLLLRHHLAAGETAAALEIFYDFHASHEMISETLVRELVHAAVREDARIALAGKLQDLLGDAQSATLFEYIGRLYLEEDMFARAETFLRASFFEEKSPLYRRRQWYFFVAVMRDDPSRALDVLSDVDASVRRYPRYFSDAFDELLQKFLARGDWERVEEAFDYLLRRGSDYSKAQYAFVLSHRAVDDAKEALLLRSYEQRESLYYHALAAYALNRPLRFPESDSGVSESSSEVARSFPELGVVKAYVELGLLSYARRVFETQQSGWSDAARYEGADMLIRAGEAYSVVSALAMRNDDRDIDFLLRYYPSVFRRLFLQASEESGVDVYLLFALAREESRFLPDARSGAGATGLMQLIDATAAETAGRHDIARFDLEEPRDNIRIGALYLASLTERWPEYSAALAAYNAGPGRLGQWKRRIPYSGPLFVEAIPFRETRAHVRKVFTSYLHYVFLYDHLDSASTTERYFGMKKQ